YYVTDRFSAGLDLSYQKMDAFLILPKAEFKYLNKRIIQLYGNAAAGLALFKANGTNATSFAFQVNPIGLRIGNRLGGFFELGAGLKGFFTLGLSFRM